MNPKIGVVDVGGGFRGIYAAGELDYCMHRGPLYALDAYREKCLMKKKTTAAEMKHYDNQEKRRQKGGGQEYSMEV